MTNCLLSIAITLSAAAIIFCIFMRYEIMYDKNRVTEAMKSIEIHNQEFVDLKKFYGERLDMHREEINEKSQNLDLHEAVNEERYSKQKEFNGSLTDFTTAQIAHNKKVIKLINEISETI